MKRLISVILMCHQTGLFSSLTNEMTLQSVGQLRNRDFVNISPLGHFPWPLERQKTCQLHEHRKEYVGYDIYLLRQHISMSLLQLDLL